MVLRFNSSVAGRFLAEAQETADLVAKLRQGLVVRGFEVVDVSHKQDRSILSYYDIVVKHQQLVPCRANGPLP